MINKIKSFLNKLNIHTDNYSLYLEAFTHASFTNENKGEKNYDRLEFLGDALFDLVVAELLFNKFPDANSGDLSKARSYLVRGEMQTKFSKDYGMGELIRYSIGEQNNVMHHKKIEEDVFEAFLGALYIDKGMLEVRKFLEKLYSSLLDNAIYQAKKNETDPKSNLQERLGSSKVEYFIIKQRDNKIADDKCIVEVRSEGILLGIGTGSNHNDAEKNAALDALNKGV